MRKLVTIRKVTDLLPIAGADNICLAVIDDGWQVIVKNEEFVKGDSCLFFEIDSFIPVEDLRFSFLKPTDYNGKEGYRLKSLKLRGALSQGLALPLAWFPELDLSNHEDKDYAEQLGVIKYDNQQIEGKGNVQVGNSEGKFPSYVPKTDQERIQNLTSWFSIRPNEEFEETLKLDGSSMTVIKLKHKLTWFDKIKKFFGYEVQDYYFSVCSRNLELRRPKDFNDRQSDFWTIAIKLNLEAKLPVGFAVQGELIGPKIQSNHEKVQELDYFVFDVYDINSARYLLPAERYEFVEKYKIKHVPIISKKAKPLKMSLQELLKHVEGPSMNKGTISEGRVYKSTTQVGISFKCISNKYLLKSEK